MEQKDFDKDKLIKYWFDSSDEDFDTQDLISDNPFVHEIKKTGIEIR